MSIKKKLNKANTLCTITFTIPKEIGKKYKKAHLVGDFNNWNTQATPMNKNKRDGSFTLTLELDTKNEYQFRYLLDGEFWLNENEADKLIPTYFQDSENSVLYL